ncbi:MAG: pyridoxal phosphate-dependent aminotransferase [Oscillospiraceae bacterium]|nr:pyridoxal phosphate-dependent aminotransferase [Oscillospiraceae bacterium]
MKDTQQLLAARMHNLGTESAFEVLARANAMEAQGKEVVHLEIGQPDFTTPDNIIEAACKAMKNGCTGYTTAQGIPQLRQVIADYYKAERNVDTCPEEVVVVPGGKPIMFYTMLSLVQPGDEVMYPNPGFPIYESCIRFAGGTPVPMPLLQENGFKIDIKKMEEQISEKTKLIIINSPGNPTGGVLDKEDVEAIAAVVRKTNAMVMSDEIYDRLIFTEQKPFSIASIPDMKDRTIILNGFSKTYAMTGWRLGYGIMNKEMAAKVTLLMVNSNSCAANFTQVAAVEAITGPQDSVETMRLAYKERLEYLSSALNEIDGIECLMPGGSFYAFPSIEGLGMDDNEFAERLLSEGGVAALAGTAFGEYGKGHIRLSAANSMENLKRAVELIKIFVEKIKAEKGE